MQIFLGDRITLIRQETWVTGICTGVVLDDRKETERLYIHGIDTAFWLSQGWQIADEEEWEPNTDEDDEDEI